MTAPDHPFKPDPDGDCLLCPFPREDHPDAPPELPHLPYAGTSGWSGSETSRERAETDDESGTTTERQWKVLYLLDSYGPIGQTWKEVAEICSWHHGQASGVLSVLHKEGRIARLAERRDRCEVYVLPEHVNGRETKAHGRKARLYPYEVICLEQIERELDHGDPLTRPSVSIVVEALRRLTA